MLIDFYDCRLLASIENEKIKRIKKIREYCSLALLIVMFILIAGGILDVELVAVCTATLSVLLKLITFKQAVESIQWGLLVMIGSALALGAAMESSGVADQIAWLLESLSASPHACLFFFMMFGIICTELISNNAAAAIFYPIGMATAKRLNVHYRPFVIASCIQASSGFTLPLGYQTHLMVLGPGNYSQRDFFRVGIFMDLIYLVLGWALIPVMFPF